MGGDDQSYGDQGYGDQGSGDQGYGDPGYGDQGDGGGTATATDDTGQASGGAVPDSDVDGAAAKRHGDYFYDVNDFDNALLYYQEAVNKGDLGGDDLADVNFNMGQCYHRKGDPSSALQPFHDYLMTSSKAANDLRAFKLYFWAATNGEYALQ